MVDTIFSTESCMGYIYSLVNIVWIQHPLVWGYNIPWGGGTLFTIVNNDVRYSLGYRIH